MRFYNEVNYDGLKFMIENIAIYYEINNSINIRQTLINIYRRYEKDIDKYQWFTRTICNKFISINDVIYSVISNKFVNEFVFFIGITIFIKEKVESEQKKLIKCFL